MLELNLELGEGHTLQLPIARLLISDTAEGRQGQFKSQKKQYLCVCDQFTVLFDSYSIE